jgi:uncharacterized protein with ATP-grasp and redox domains
MISICTEKEETLKPIPAPCRPCSLDQALSACRFARLNEAQTEKVLAAAEAGLAESEKTPLLVQHIVRLVADSIIDIKGEGEDFDIYREVKETSNRLAQEVLPGLSEAVKVSGEPLEAALQIAAAANIIDFGAETRGDLDMEKELLNLGSVPFGCFQIDEFRERLAASENLLYLCDNCGEIVLDKLFVEQLKKNYPHLKITAAVREKPVINDATLEDAAAVGLDKLVPVVSSGSVYPGTVLSECSSSFLKLYEDADIILSKGQGNFETLLPERDGRSFFLLRIKCALMAERAGVEKGKLILMRGA